MKKDITLVFGGAGAKSFACLGAWSVIKKAKLPVQRILGSSMGAFMGALVANDVPEERIKEEFYKKTRFLCWTNLAFTRRSVLSQKRFRTILKSLIKVKNVEESRIPLHIITANLNTVQTHVFENGDMIDAVCASCAYPILYKPMILNNQYIITDGGIINNVPADIAREKSGPDSCIITISPSSPFDTSLEALNKPTELAFRIYYSMVEKERTRITETYSDVVLKPFKDEYLGFRTWRDMFNFFNVEKLESFYEKGKKEAELKLPEILEKVQS
ncbi:MAG: patatin-like phospholipase family protein [Chlamydiota bacterium]|nr:patatin-like phospholipase family protein [Chlamydiota bacterium]